MKIGVITLYRDNVNYGANLQAYALCEILRELGVDAEQICYYDNNCIHKVISDLFDYARSFKTSKELRKRKKTIGIFRDTIPHSKLYFKNTVIKANERYDAFIVGSDQVWNPSWLTSIFKLDFASSDKRRISYAASIGKLELNEREAGIFSGFLENFDYISVREPESIEMLSKFTKKRISWALDPTMLISREGWDKICKPKYIFDKYIFCYFLKDNQDERDIASQYAKNHNCKIVTLPYLSYQYRRCDDGFGDYLLYEVDPALFISLIKHADYVFTDSFHAAVFSHLYEKELVIFGQPGQQSNVRMQSLTKLFGTEERHIYEAERISIKTIEDFSQIQYGKKNSELQYMKEESVCFLRRALGLNGVNNGKCM
jgi:hypothetical protein